MSEIIEQSPSADRATAYRTIKLYDELHITRRVWFGHESRVELSDKFIDHHHHIICQSCGKIEKFDHIQIERAIKKVAKQSEYKLTGHTVEIIGVCGDCADKD